MTVELSHGKPRLMRPRLSDVSSAATAGEPNREGRDERGRFTVGNRAAVERSARRAITIRERQLLEAELAKLPDSSVTPSERARLLRDVRALFRSACRSVASASPIVVASLASYARSSVIASLLTARAVEAGVDTPRGLQLLEAAQRSEARGERASLHAVSMAKLLAEPGRKSLSAPWLEDDDGGAP
jgi:hypothetical protein